MTRDELTTLLALVVALMWALSIIAAFITGKTTILAAITPVMLIVAGFLFGYRSPKGDENE